MSGLAEFTGKGCAITISEVANMLANEEVLREWQESSSSLRAKTIDAAVGAYFDALGKSECPGPADIQAAVNAAESSLVKQVLTPDWIAAFSRASPQDPEMQAALELSFNAVRPALKLPPPVTQEELSPFRIGLAALIGAIGGMFVLTPLARFLLGMRDVGLFLGPPIGAFLLVLAACYSARNKRFRRFLRWALGVATIAEVWAILTGGGILRRVWPRLGWHRSALKRILLYVVIIFVLVLAKPRPRYERQDHEELIRSAIDQWLDAAIPTLGLLIMTPKTAPVSKPDFGDLAQKVLDLRHVPPDNLPAATEELIQTLKNVGVQVDEQDTFCWQTEHRQRYKVFGHVEPGELVVIERQAIVLNGEIYRKGLVRKIRERD